MRNIVIDMFDIIKKEREMGKLSVDEVHYREKKLNEIRKSHSDFVIHKDEPILGDGGFSKVYRGTYGFTTVAIKVIEFSSAHGNWKEIENELLLLKHVEHPKIVHCYGFSSSRTEFVIILDYFMYGSLDKFLDRNDILSSINHLDLVMIAWIFDISAALDYIHSKKVKHLDVKPANCLVNDKLSLCISDFGLSKEHSSFRASTLKSSIAGTLAYCAPEVLTRTHSSFASDIFSLGMSVVHIITRRPPQMSDCTTQVNHAVGRLNDAFVKKDEIACLLIECVHTSPDSRPSAKELVRRLNSVIQANGGDPRSHHAFIQPPPVPSSVIQNVAPPPTISTSSEQEIEDQMRIEMNSWLTGKCKIMPRQAKLYSTKLIEKNIGCIERLAKRLLREDDFLVKLGFDEDDIDDIKAILFNPMEAKVEAEQEAAEAKA